ncbi:MAG: bifunctional hydroxymethylpyrimidine kinase/phosphomethylpyrimidine kinase [Candidatus Njordarchaeales archaeon]
MMRIFKALTIAGSDSGGGAGIQADLKTFSALGVFGMSVITSITAQNTREVLAIHDVPPDVIKLQIKAVVEDIGVDAAKTGMLRTSEIIKAVAGEVKNYDFPLVVDPVMIAKSGAPLMDPEARETLIKELLPLAKVVTPNLNEAKALTNMDIKNVEDMKKAAKMIVEKYGCEAAIVKGGHVEVGEEAIDVMYWNGEYYFYKTPRIDSKNTHGTGCTFSAAIAAELAKGQPLSKAVEKAKKFIYLAIKFGLDIGQGFGPVNHMASLYREAERYKKYRKILGLLDIIESEEGLAKLVPEVGMNIAIALDYAVDSSDVIAIPGRIRPVMGRAKAAGCPDFGVSRHLASYILVAREYDPEINSAINIKYNEGILRELERMGLKISYYERTQEPEEIKKIEGMSIPWGTREAIKRLGEVPDVIYHRGDIGKEPMIVLLGKDPEKLVKILIELSKRLDKK